MVGRRVNILLHSVHNMNPCSHTYALIPSGDDNTIYNLCDDFDCVQREEGVKDELRLVVQCPHTEDHRHCIYQRHSFISLEVNMKSHTLRHQKNQGNPRTNNIEYLAFEVSLSRADIGNIK